MEQKTFFADIKGVGPTINSEGDYDEYRVRCGLRTDRYEHSDSIVKKGFKGTLNTVSAKSQALAFVEEARKTLTTKSAAAQPTTKSKKGGAK